MSAAQSFVPAPLVPSASPQAPRRIWSIGGGKGGIGKSLLAASLGAQLARMGKRDVRKIAAGLLQGENLTLPWS